MNQPFFMLYEKLSKKAFETPVVESLLKELGLQHGVDLRPEGYVVDTAVLAALLSIVDCVAKIDALPIADFYSDQADELERRLEMCLKWLLYADQKAKR